MPKLHEEKVNVLKKPEWLKIRLHRTAEYADVQRIDLQQRSMPEQSRMLEPQDSDLHDTG